MSAENQSVKSNGDRVLLGLMLMATGGTSALAAIHMTE